MKWQLTCRHPDYETPGNPWVRVLNQEQMTEQVIDACSAMPDELGQCYEYEVLELKPEKAVVKSEFGVKSWVYYTFLFPAFSVVNIE